MLCLCRSLVLDCTRAAPPAYELQQRPGGCTSFSRLQPYALFQRCGAPEFAMWGRPIFFAWHKDGSVGRPLVKPVLRRLSTPTDGSFRCIRLVLASCKTLEQPV
jgi:hypothetical protein